MRRADVVYTALILRKPLALDVVKRKSNSLAARHLLI